MVRLCLEERGFEWLCETKVVSGRGGGVWRMLCPVRSCLVGKFALRSWRV